MEDLADLREGHLLDQLVFESDSSTSGQSKSAANYVPKSTVFQVIVSSDGQHFKASIHEEPRTVEVDETGAWSIDEVSCRPPRLPSLDAPEGPIIAIRG
jgi:hypothetical protein